MSETPKYAKEANGYRFNNQVRLIGVKADTKIEHPWHWHDPQIGMEAASDSTTQFLHAIGTKFFDEDMARVIATEAYLWYKQHAPKTFVFVVVKESTTGFFLNILSSEGTLLLLAPLLIKTDIVVVRERADLS